jgi:uncharacterized protein (DUF2141 family)
MWALILAGVPSASDGATLVVQVRGAKSDRGSVHCFVYRGRDGFPSRPDRAVAKAQSAVRQRRAECRFDVPAGPAAVAVYQDLNGNGKMDANALGIPKEPTAVSNDARGKFGPPKYDAARFTVGTSTTTISVKLR